MEEWVKSEGIKKYKQVVTEQPWGCKYSTGNGVATELILLAMDMNNGVGIA